MNRQIGGGTAASKRSCSRRSESYVEYEDFSWISDQTVLRFQIMDRAYGPPSCKRHWLKRVLRCYEVSCLSRMGDPRYPAISGTLESGVVEDLYHVLKLFRYTIGWCNETY